MTAKNIIRQTPIAVYQMGKVGSETIVNSIENLNLTAPVYHIHVLSENNLNRAISYHQRQNQKLTLQLKHSQKIRSYLDADNSPLTVISAVREPISQYISAFFQNIKSNYPNFILPDGAWNEEEIYNHLVQKLSNYNPQTEWNCNWFDHDFKSALGVDIYQHEFDREQGYTQLTKDNINILVLQLEKSQNWQNIISKFLKLPEPITILKCNQGNNKQYKLVYDSILERMKMPKQTLEAIYNSKYCQHFYSNTDRKEFFTRWVDKES